MKTRIKWVQDAEFVGESGSGHSVVMDGPPDFGGKNRGVRPMEMILHVPGYNPARAISSPWAARRDSCRQNPAVRPSPQSDRCQILRQTQHLVPILSASSWLELPRTVCP